MDVPLLTGSERVSRDLLLLCPYGTGVTSNNYRMSVTCFDPIALLCFSILIFDCVRLERVLSLHWRDDMRRGSNVWHPYQMMQFIISCFPAILLLYNSFDQFAVLWFVTSTKVCDWRCCVSWVLLSSWDVRWVVSSPDSLALPCRPLDDDDNVVVV